LGLAGPGQCCECIVAAKPEGECPARGDEARDEIKGLVPEIYVFLKPGASATLPVAAKVTATVETMIGESARPKRVHIVPGMPKTHSGKTMRRVLASISNTRDTGDVTTLVNHDVIEQIRKLAQGQAALDMREGPEDLNRFSEAKDSAAARVRPQSYEGGKSK
jgi:hypothetical protein